MKTFKYVSLTIGVLFLLFCLAFGLEWLGIGWEGFFGPKRENVRRQVFEETQSFNQGKQQDLAKYFLEYKRAEDEVDRKAIQSVVQSQFSYVDADNVNSPELRSFLKKMRGF